MLFKMEFRFLPTAVHGKMTTYATKNHRENTNNNIRRSTSHMFYSVAINNKVHSPKDLLSKLWKLEINQQWMW